MPAARRTAMEYTSALKFMRQKAKFWKPQVRQENNDAPTGTRILDNSQNNFFPIIIITKLTKLLLESSTAEGNGVC